MDILWDFLIHAVQLFHVLSTKLPACIFATGYRKSFFDRANIMQKFQIPIDQCYQTNFHLQHLQVGAQPLKRLNNAGRHPKINSKQVLVFCDKS